MIMVAPFQICVSSKNEILTENCVKYIVHHDVIQRMKYYAQEVGYLINDFVII